MARDILILRHVYHAKRKYPTKHSRESCILKCLPIVFGDGYRQLLTLNYKSSNVMCIFNASKYTYRIYFEPHE